MNMDENIDKQGLLYAALAKAQGGMANPVKNREVAVKSDRGSYKFAYATLDAILDIVRPALSANGLAFTQTLEKREDGMVMCLRLFHGGGGMVSTCMPLDQSRIAKMQEMGSLMTFARRYQIASFFGLAAEEDDDANGADGNTVQSMKDRPPAKPDARSEFKRVRDAMNAAKDATELAEVMLSNKWPILAVKEASEAGYTELMAVKDRLIVSFTKEEE
jgi:hypothetical protein